MPSRPKKKPSTPERQNLTEVMAETPQESRATPTATPPPQTMPLMTPTTPTTPFDMKLQSSREIKVLKNHCVFYDLLIKEKILKLIEQTDNSNKKLNYYKELFEDHFDNANVEFDLETSNINDFFNNEDNKLLSKTTDLINYFVSNGDNKTLFVIPTFFDENKSKDTVHADVELFNDDKKSYLKKREIYRDFYRGINITQTEREEKSVHIYTLPCLVPKLTTKLSEADYVKKLKKELIDLQEFLKKDFLAKIGTETQDVFKNISFFCEQDSKISLKFYEKAISPKNIEYLNKHLFKELSKLKGDVKEGKQTFVISDRVEQPIVYKKSRSQINELNDDIEKFLTFLVQKILSGEILSTFKTSELVDVANVQELKIIFKHKIKHELNDFKPSLFKQYRFIEKKLKYAHGDFFIHESEKRDIEKYKDQKDISKKYWKISETSKGGASSDFLSFFAKSSDEDKEVFLRITSRDSLTSAGIYVKNGNMYEEVMKGIVQSVRSQAPYRQLKTSNLVRNLQKKHVYFFENFNFTMESFRKFVEEQDIYGKTDTKLATKSISKHELRKKFIETFTSKTLLNDYFLFCLNDERFKKSIISDFYKEDKTVDEKKKIKQSIIETILKELFKKGSEFYTNEQTNAKRSMTTSSSTKQEVSYNTYRIKRFDERKTKWHLTEIGNITGPIIEELNKDNRRDNDYKLFKTVITNAQGKIDMALVHIILEIDDKDGLENNTEILDIFKPQKVKCSTRKKIVGKTFRKMLHNTTQKLRFKLRAFI
jgi:hypothetical protein